MSGEDSDESPRKPDRPYGERPLKKARFVWQVKGKYHLKEADSIRSGSSSRWEDSLIDDDDDDGDSCISEEMMRRMMQDRIQRRTEHDDDHLYASDNNNISNNNEEDCCRENILANAQNILDEPDNNNGSQSESSQLECITDDPIVVNDPLAPVLDGKDNSHFYLRWQTRHITRSFIDNTINRILESYDRDFVREQCSLFCSRPPVFGEMRDDEVEAEGISMAIQSHGLQTNSVSSARDRWSRVNNSIMDTTIVEADSSGQEGRISSATEVAAYILNLPEPENAESEDSMHCDSADNQEEADFMNAAVSVAIQNKGLSSSSY